MTIITVYTGCAKDDDQPIEAGTGGSAEISAYVRHHENQNLIAGARIFVKFGASSFPGADTTLYDAVYTCGSTGHGLGHAHIEGMHHGAYWLYAVGYDSTTATVVTGDNDIVLETETDIEEITVSVE